MSSLWSVLHLWPVVSCVRSVLSDLCSLRKACTPISIYLCVCLTSSCQAEIPVTASLVEARVEQQKIRKLGKEARVRTEREGMS